ncbi:MULTISPECIES: NAD(P)/FAD-dependent oxidoreductase [unclassified Carboxydocella]|uniref:NAD(P)/FAD-dependent oxidoreductase n=1 Tax=unclassified Carboxydocella TaxID=2685367 RepID=UPI0009AC68D1|nr:MULTISPECIES: NAD(P)/FAD-dependent oxidoreductase [unclassified Carboxydocella]GAW27828.1 NADH dehydrogenase [Carboxydocella sp. ULO1]GAW31744.1 NADH dehydrogenase [Carboxydocella sp. JDF658]
MTMQTKPRILILGAGYAGMICAKKLSKKLPPEQAEIILVNKHSYHQFLAQIHEPAAGRNDFEDVRVEIAEVLDLNRVRFHKGIVSSIDRERQQVHLSDGTVLSYDYLIIALGSEPEYFGIPGLAENALTLHSLNGARLIHTHIANALARYKAEPEQKHLLTFVIGGAGFTGVELATELADWLPELARRYDIPVEKTKIINIEAAPCVLPGNDAFLCEQAAQIMAAKGIELITQDPIHHVESELVCLKSGRQIHTGTIIWTGGVRGNRVVEASGFPVQRGRTPVDAFNRAQGWENIFVIGDCSLPFGPEGKPLPPTAQVALQQAEHVGENLVNLLTGQPLTPFRFIHRGVVASLGRRYAVGKVKKYRATGLIGHILKEAVAIRYLYKLGGLPLVIKKGLLA